jgi:hypothetical protein
MSCPMITKTYKSLRLCDDLDAAVFGKQKSVQDIQLDVPDSFPADMKKGL